MRVSQLRFAVSLAAAFAASAATAAPAKKAAKSAPPSAADAHAFVETMNADYRARYMEPNAAEWVAEGYNRRRRSVMFVIGRPSELAISAIVICPRR